MRTISRRPLVLMFFGGILCWRVASGLGTASQAPAREDKTGPTPLYYGVSACVDCHSKGTDQPDPVCRCTEVPIWEKQDKHKNAYTVLKGERARQMGELLKINVTEDKSCLTCHGVYIADADLRKRSEEVGFKLEDGVSCAACHGAFEEWVDQHGSRLKRPTWRKKTRAQKEKESGMYDLWDPMKRTQVCASCHVGSPRENKVVTHAMYAAGHPPLPGFEIATFSDAMPRHWQLLREKPAAAQQLLQYDGTRLEQTRLVAESGIADFRDAMSLLVEQASQCAKAADAEKQVLDLAVFDCYACHHDLKPQSWRQRRGYSGPPGRPQMRPWPMALVRLGIRHAARTDEPQYQALSEELNKGLKKLHDAFNARPYGDCQQVALAAQGLVDYSAKLLTAVRKNAFDETAARLLLKQLCTSPAYQDYDSARQTVWAFRTIYEEVTPKPDEKVLAALKALNDELHLDLPAGQQTEIVKELDQTLQKIAAYDPERFRVRFAALCNALQ